MRYVSTATAGRCRSTSPKAHRNRVCGVPVDAARHWEVQRCTRSAAHTLTSETFRCHGKHDDASYRHSYLVSCQVPAKLAETVAQQWGADRPGRICWEGEGFARSSAAPTVSP